MKPKICPLLPIGLLLALSALGGSSRAESPSAAQALQLVPTQRGVEFDLPKGAEVDKCTIGARRLNGQVGWVVEDSNGLTIRQFVDTNGDNVVDRWSYYKDGLEVYRDMDADYDGKADQHRWLHTAGSRWGIDKNEDGEIDAWKSISAEEVTSEVIAALALRDAGRFARLVVTSAELKSLGLGPAKEKELAGKIAGLQAAFEDLVARQKQVTGTTKWIQFSASRPGIVPAGTAESTKDLLVYENVMAVVQTGESHGQVQMGTLVKLGDAWRVIDIPLLTSDDPGQLSSSGFFFRSSTETPIQTDSGGPSQQTRELWAQLEELDKQAAGATTVQQQAKLDSQRADLLEQIAQQADTPADRAMWLRQLADTIGAAVQSGTYPDGVKRLAALFEKLRSSKDKDLAPYVRFRQLTAEYNLAIQAGGDFVKLQSEWLKSLEQYVSQYPTSPDAAEAMLQLAMAQEIAGEEDDAKKWYSRVEKEFPSSLAARKATGARTRLDSVGKTISLLGKTPTGELVDLSKYRGRVVLIQYWASWCEPCKSDMPAIKDLLSKYGRDGFSVIGVNLDANLGEMNAYLGTNSFPWQHIFEEGGLDSRPANELGILTLPTMILIDKQGRVVSRNILVAELDGKLRTLIR